MGSFRFAPLSSSRRSQIGSNPKPTKAPPFSYSNQKSRVSIFSPKMDLLDLRRMLLFSAVLRLVLIVYGEWQDAHMEVRYTDIDYFVFSDAADLVSNGKSPFERSTYRYSPLLAFLLVPNSLVHRTWGKLLFSSAGMNFFFLTLFVIFMIFCIN